jgi:hypothetical protein
MCILNISPSVNSHKTGALTGDRDMPDKNLNQPCTNNELHDGHMCELESQQEWEIIRQITDNPHVKCENCGATANLSRNVCMPTEL